MFYLILPFVKSSIHENAIPTIKYAEKPQQLNKYPLKIFPDETHQVTMIELNDENHGKSNLNLKHSSSYYIMILILFNPPKTDTYLHVTHIIL
jgi:hypothetical protein